MKLLILSDTHRNIQYPIEIINNIKGKIDGIIHLGDLVEDAVDLSTIYNDLPFHIVAGNCDYACEAPDEKILKINGTTIFITHGHKQKVKWGLDRLSYAAEENNASIALFGHTHQPLIGKLGNVILFNPGSISSPRGLEPKPTYGILEITHDGIPHPAIVNYKANYDIRCRS